EEKRVVGRAARSPRRAFSLHGQGEMRESQPDGAERGRVPPGQSAREPAVRARCGMRGNCARQGGYGARSSERVMKRFIACGDPHRGFARIYCDGCGHDYLLALSRKTRYFRLSCHRKRVLLYGESVEAFRCTTRC